MAPAAPIIRHSHSVAWTALAALWLCYGLALPVRAAAAAEEKPADKVVVSFPYFDPSDPEGYWTEPLIKLMKKRPELEVRRWGGISLPGGAGRVNILMSIAGDTAPDFFYCYWHIIRNDIKNGFLYPLNEWVGDDRNGNGQLDLEEATWDGWKKIPLLWRQVSTEKGKVYGIPFAGTWYYALVYRKDLVQQAGLDPEKPPETWDEFFYWCQKMTLPNKEIPGATLKRGQRGYALSPDQA
ncbi:MAG: extracellular solute-binding protein, partial [Planctomycetota bacterium]